MKMTPNLFQTMFNNRTFRGSLPHWQGISPITVCLICFQHADCPEEIFSNDFPILNYVLLLLKGNIEILKHAHFMDEETEIPEAWRLAWGSQWF